MAFKIADPRLLARAALAWNRQDWDALLHLMIPLLPSLTDDGSGHTACPARVVFGRLIPVLKLPGPMDAAARRYLAQATDRQLGVLATTVETVADALTAEGELPRGALALVP